MGQAALSGGAGAVGGAAREVPRPASSWPLRLLGTDAQRNGEEGLGGRGRGYFLLDCRRGFRGKDDLLFLSCGGDEEKGKGSEGTCQKGSYNFFHGNTSQPENSLCSASPL